MSRTARSLAYLRAGKGKGAGKVAPVRTQGQGGAEGEDKEGLSKEEPPPDERTWLQKNWLLLLPVGFVVRSS